MVEARIKWFMKHYFPIFPFANCKTLHLCITPSPFLASSSTLVFKLGSSVNFLWYLKLISNQHCYFKVKFTFYFLLSLFYLLGFKENRYLAFVMFEFWYWHVWLKCHFFFPFFCWQYSSKCKFHLSLFVRKKGIIRQYGWNGRRSTPHISLPLRAFGLSF